jgi:hypothetical protein
MRILINTLLVTALLAWSATTASAISLSLDIPGSDFSPADQVSVAVNLDTEADLGIVLLSVGVLFDETRLSFNQAASSTTSYLLYSGAGKTATFLESSCGFGVFGGTTGCPYPRVGTTNQVNVDFLSNDLLTGTPIGTQVTGAPLMATLIFDVVGPPGFAAIDISITSPGNIIQLSGGVAGTASLSSGAGGVLILPEPTTALLLGLGLAGLGLTQRRRHSSSST